MVELARPGGRARALTIGLGLAGTALAIGLVAHYGVWKLAALLWACRSAIALVVFIHGLQIALTAAAWQSVMPAGPLKSDRAKLISIRLVREAVGGLLPAGQIASILASLHLLRRFGMSARMAVSVIIVDLTVEMTAQGFFTVLGLLVLVQTLGAVPPVIPLVSVLTAFGLMLAGLIASQRFGFARFAERLAAQFGAADLAGLHQELMAIYVRHSAMMKAGLCHLSAWTLGTMEVWLALHYAGHDVDLPRALVIESLGQALSAVSFAVPAALGVQEGGYVLLCMIFGIGPHIGLAVSLIKRARMLLLGAPGFALWIWLAREPSATGGPVGDGKIAR